MLFLDHEKDLHWYRFEPLVQCDFILEILWSKLLQNSHPNLKKTFLLWD